MIQVGEVRPYFQPRVGPYESVPMRVLAVINDKVIARPVGSLTLKSFEYELADFERWYPEVRVEVEIEDHFIANPKASARVWA